MKIYKKFLGIGILFILYIFLYKLLIPRINAFGCMDDCNNFMGGYFLLHGKQLFSQIFFNHAPFMAHISEGIQYITHPQNLHEIILRHRQFLLLFGLFSEIILFLRFGFLVIPFALVYECTKFYLTGDRFLGESFIVYPLVYLLGISLEKMLVKKIKTYDLILASIFTWFVLFTREPYSIVVLFLYGSFLWGKISKEKMVSILLLLVLCAVTFFSYNSQEFIYNIITVNKTNLAAENADSGVLGINMYKVFTYPIIIFFQGEWNFMRYIEMMVAALFIYITIFLFFKKQWKIVLWIWIVLGFSNFRLVRPGHEYYGAFHLLPWYSMTMFSTLFLSYKNGFPKKYLILTTIGFLGIFLFVLVSKGSYVHDKVDQQTEFINNYGNVFQVGNVVAALSTPQDTLFLDGSDDAIYLVAKRYSPYQYSWYTSLMPVYKKYTDARLKMLTTNLPDFYYKACTSKDPNSQFPLQIQKNYVRLYNQKNVSCLWVKNTKLPTITKNQWKNAGSFLYYRTAQ